MKSKSHSQEKIIAIRQEAEAGQSIITDLDSITLREREVDIPIKFTQAWE